MGVQSESRGEVVRCYYSRCVQPRHDNTPTPSQGEGVSARPSPVSGEWANGCTLGRDEGDAGADMDVAVIDPAEAGATPEEVHLADEHPIAARGDADDLGEMADEVRALHATGEGDRRARRGHTGALVAAAPEDIGLSGVQHLRPPVTPAEAGAENVAGGIRRVDISVAARRDGPLADVGHEHGRALTGLAGSRECDLIGRRGGGAFAQAGGRGGGQAGLAWHPPHIVGDGGVANVVPVGGAVEYAAGPAIAEPAVDRKST